MFYFDPLYIIIILPGFLLALFASFYTKAIFNKYSEVNSSTGITGAEAARRLLDNRGLNHVRVEQVGGFLSDHYDPSCEVLRLSNQVYNSHSLSAIGVACHEAGHALQHADNYKPLSMRTALVPAIGVSSNFSYLIIILGFAFQANFLILTGVILFSISVLFTIVTLPVEWNASARAKELMVSAGIVTSSEAEDAGKVLNAAFLTYVASTITAVLTLIYFLIRAGILGGSRDD